MTRRCQGKGCGKAFEPATCGQRVCPNCLKKPSSKKGNAAYIRNYRANRQNCKKCHARLVKWGCSQCDANDRRALTLILVCKETDRERQMVLSPSSRTAREFKVTKEEVKDGIVVRSVRYVAWLQL